MLSTSVLCVNFLSGLSRPLLVCITELLCGDSFDLLKRIPEADSRPLLVVLSGPSLGILIVCAVLLRLFNIVD